jgi:single-stranded-DNA-specific exonuclease
MTRRWLLQEAQADLSSGAGATSSLIERILRVRGYEDAALIEQFCDPKLTQLHDPSLMPNIDIAAERIIHAIRAGQQIVIYGDYDVDGITATAILYHIIKAIQSDAKLRTYVPHRLEEGYGINCAALEQLRRDGADLVITVDCGITAKTSAATARAIGLDLIITDHHNLPVDEADLPDACALVHPRLPGSAYPFGELCGAGVAFKLAWRLATMWCNSQRVSEVLQRTLLEVLPLVALGSIADVVPLVDENRVLTRFGLQRIKHTKLEGLRALIVASDLAKDDIDAEKVGFVLGPRLNACGRMGHAGEAVHLLCDARADEAMKIAQKLTVINKQRQQTERAILERAMRMAEDAGMTGDDRRAIVLADEAWHPGVVGIVCSRLVDRFARPTILMERNGELCKGSGRSIDGYCIHSGLATCAPLLTTWGGHAMAAGLSLPVDHLEAFTEQFTEHANANITVDQMIPALRVDCDAALHELDARTVERIEGLSPFGRGNRRPMLRVTGAVIADAPRQIGSTGKHLSLRLREDVPGVANRQQIRVVWWNAGAYAGDLAAGMPVDVVLQPKINVWNGKKSVEAELRDVRLRERVAAV